MAGFAAAAPGLAIFSGDDSDPAATMRAGGAGLISGRGSAYPEVYAALTAAQAAGDQEAAARHQQALDRIVALGQSIGRLKYALGLRGLGSTAARMTVDPPDAEVAAAIAAEVAALLSGRAVARCRRLRCYRRLRTAGVVRCCEPPARVARLVVKRSGESGAPDLKKLGNRAGAGPADPARAGTGQRAGVSGAPGLTNCRGDVPAVSASPRSCPPPRCPRRGDAPRRRG